MGTDETMPEELSPAGAPVRVPREPRHVVCIAAQLEDDGSKRPGVTWDVSTSGALILTRGRLQVGDPVKIVLHLPEGPASGLIVTGKVVRSVPLDSQRIGLWSESIGIAFDEPAQTLEPAVEHLSARQAEMFGQPRTS